MYDTAKTYLISNGKKIELDVDFDKYETNMYICAYNDNAKECYLTLTTNDDKVDSDVLPGSVVALGNGEGIIYLTDPDDQMTEGTLKMYSGSDSIRIADDVAVYQSNDKGEVAFLADYNFDKYRGDLKVFKNNKIISMDTDVTSILYY